MSFSRVINLYLNLDAPVGNPLVTSLTNAQIRGVPQFVQGDTAILRIWTLAESGNASAPFNSSQLASGSQLVFAGKASSALSAETLLFAALLWSEHNTSDDESGYWYYQAELNLNTTELDAAITGLSGTATSLPVKCDIEIQNADNSQRLTYQCDASILRQVYDGESSPTPGTPPYPLPSAIGLRGLTTPDLRLDLNTLTGGTPEALDSIPTVSLDTPYLLILPLTGALRAYLLTPGTETEASPGIIRPDDYATATNEKTWKQIL